jgi:hypothetical protein
MGAAADKTRQCLILPGGLIPKAKLGKLSLSPAKYCCRNNIAAKKMNRPFDPRSPR